MKVALVCTGLGQVRRGFEKFTEELFDLLKDDLDITLFKGGGKAGDREIIIPNLRRDGWFQHMPFVSQNGYRDAYYYEVLSFSALLLPYLMAKGYDILHYIDPPLGNFLFHVKTKLKLKFKFKTLLTNGVALRPEHCRLPDHVHHASPVPYDAFLASGIPAERMTLLPLGVHVERFLMQADRRQLRRQWDIPENRVVILSVAAINRGHKRIDYLIEEVARLDSRYFLVVAGRLEDPSLKRMAEERLSNRYRFITEPLYDRIVELYRLSNLGVICSLAEGFGFGIVEAMCAGLPVLTHDAPHFRWLVAEDSCLIDMTKPGRLMEAIRVLSQDKEWLQRVGKMLQEQACDRFDWSKLMRQYVEMYRYVCEQSKVT